MIEIRDLSVAFGGVHALSNLSVTLNDTVIGIIGPNGAGKTTLLNAFSGFVDTQSGSIHAFGTNLLTMAPHKRTRWGLRRSFQTEQVVDDLSVEDNIRVILDSLPISRREAEKQIADVLDYVQLSKKADELGESLNAYDRRMVELAKTLVGTPKIVMLDEPGAGLREDEVIMLRDSIKGIHDRFGSMTLLIDHDVDIIAATCITTIVLDFGELLTVGPTNEVLNDDRVKAAYLGLEEVDMEEVE